MDVPLPLHPRQQIHDPKTVLTPVLLEVLGAELGVRWPDWFKTLMLALIDARPLSYDIWLPGGFLFGKPFYVLRDTKPYKDGITALYDSKGSKLSWPPTLVIVGHYSAGAVAVETASDEWILWNIYREGSYLRPFVEIAKHCASPGAFAQTLIDSDVRSDRRMDEENRRKAEIEMAEAKRKFGA